MSEPIPEVKDVGPIDYNTFCQLACVLDREYRKANDSLKARLKAFQSQCKHASTYYQGDPAGGSDSCHICNLCNKAI